MSMDLAEEKAILRRRAQAWRADAAARAGPDAALDLRDHALAVLDAAKGDTVSGFWPMRDEIDTRPLLEALHAGGAVCCLPVVAERAAPLVFRRWAPGDPMADGGFGTRVPAASAPLVTPTKLLVPLLAFDRAGYRLGYGGGYYDRTLAALREASPAGSVLAVGVAYAAQEIDDVPHDARDMRLDWVVTETGALYMGGTPTARNS